MVKLVTMMLLPPMSKFHLNTNLSEINTICNSNNKLRQSGRYTKFNDNYIDKNDSESNV